MVDNDKQIRANTNNIFIDEHVNINNDDVHSTTILSPTRVYSSPLMGTSARAAKRRMDSADTANQSPQILYQNTQQIFDEQSSNKTKQDLLQQKPQSKPVTYDTPPRDQQQQQQAQKVITKITTTTTTNSPTLHNRSNSLTKESSSTMTPVDRLLEQAAEIQRPANNNLPSPTSVTTTISNDSSKPVIFERTDQYRIFLDPSTGEPRRRSVIPVNKTGHSTDIDEAQEQADRFHDDHQAIQQLTRVLQEHNTTTINEYKRLPSQTSPILINTTTTTTTTTIPSNLNTAAVERTDQFTVIDALLDNPLGSTNNKQNQSLHARFNDILRNLRNSDYVNALKQSTAKLTKKKRTKPSANVTLVDKETQLNESMISPNVSSSDQTVLIPSNKKKKSKKSPADINYHVLDALISSPVSLRLPESYLTKYNVNPPLTQLSLTSSKTDIHKTNNVVFLQQVNAKVKDETVSNLDKIVNDLLLHGQHTSTVSLPIRPTSLERSNQPKFIYGYIDEQDIVLNISPSESHELSVNSKSRTVEPTYLNGRHILPEYEQRTTWHEQSKLPTTVTREDLELHDKRIPRISERSSSITRTIPISYEYEYPIKTSTPLYTNQENIQLSRLPLSYYLDQPYNPNKTLDYESDSSESDRSTLYQSYKHIPISNRPLFHRTHSSNRSPPRLSHPPRDISPDSTTNNPRRNYIEVFRDGENRPSEIYLLPFNESVPFNQRHSRFDQYHSNQYQRKSHQSSSSSPIRKTTKIIPTVSNHNQNLEQPNPEFENYLRQSKSFDYRPLRLKLQREYKVTPSLLVDEWEQQPIESTSTISNIKTSVSSPDDVFIKQQ